MLLGAVADDFTGASDLANTLARGGMATVQFVGAGQGSAAAGCEAGVVALKTRSIAAADAVSQSLDAARWLLDQGCRQIIFKYCSTFDSTPEGNIGPVAEALLDLLGAEVAVVCPAFPATGRRLFMGHLFVGDRLLSESGMEKHPLTPMTDPDIRRWLRRQTKGEVGHVALDAVRGGHVRGGVRGRGMAGRRLVVADAVTDADLLALGAAVAGHRLVTGVRALRSAFPQIFALKDCFPAPDASARGARSRRGPVRLLLDGLAAAGRNPSRKRGRPGGRPVRTDARRHDRCARRRLGRKAGRRCADRLFDGCSGCGRRRAGAIRPRTGRRGDRAFFGELARILADRGVRRIVVGGGETSGAIVEALGVRSLRIGSEIDPGVPVLVADRDGPLGLALKSGNFGSPDFFAKAIVRIGSA